ncbi:MAG TPA: CAP domain-containing protein [Kofleriaceae bacterium]
MKSPTRVASHLAVLLGSLHMLSCLPRNQQPPPPTEPLPMSRPVEGAAPAKPAKPAKTTKADSMDPVAKQFIDAHNAVRAKHCAPSLTWSKKLADIAQNWANTLASKGCVFGHSPGAKYGENLAAGTQGALDPSSTVAMWYDEIRLYKFPNGGFSAQTGHFTQVVWRSTKQVGCGHVTCKGNDIYVCTYDPPGNWEGQYRNQVLPASCKK